MKQISNKKTSLKKSDGTFQDYKGLIEAVITNPPKEGFEMATMLKTKRVIDCIAKEGEIIDLEDSDYEFLKNSVKSFKWAIYHTDIIDFLTIFE